MNNKLIGFIPINAILMIITIVYFNNQNSSGLANDVIFSCFLICIGTVVYLNSSKISASKWFIILIYITAWILLLLNGPSRIFFGLSRILMSLAPIVLFIFFVHFTNIPRKRLYKKCCVSLWISGFLTLIALLSFNEYLSYCLFIHLLFAIFYCIYLSFKYKSKQRKILSRYQTILNLAMLVSLLPFIITHTFLRKFLSEEVQLYSIYTFVALPIVVGYILINRNELQIGINYRFLAKIALITLGEVAIFIIFCIYVTDLSLIQSLLILFVVSIIYFSSLLIQRHFSTQQLYIVNQTKEKLEKERLEILQRITYDSYLSTLSNLINQFIQKTISLNGTLIIWKENHQSFILEQSGVFEHLSLKKYNQNQLKSTLHTITFGQKQYFSFPLKYKNIVNGWLIIGQKLNKEKFTPEDINKITILADTICEILKTTEILHGNQQRYIQLPSIKYDEYLNITLVQKVEEIRRNFALYLHDDILQSILAVKNMTESLVTPQKDTQQLIITTFQDLNKSIREKMFDIYPSTLSDLGLYQSISIMCEKLKREAVHQPHLKIRLEAEPLLEVDNKLQYTIFRTVKELLQNAIKHAQANEIRISLNMLNNRILIIDVIDDGKGFDIAADLEKNRYTNHIGLLTIKQEINDLQGEFTIKNNMESGTHIQIRIPMKGNE
ncbi:hypothetical protein UB51_24555 [Paenibacillus sp. IHBB 10380]|nr:hypothetical protein UB51_24555 [Paenibacillus sp. IHBB 10380]